MAGPELTASVWEWGFRSRFRDKHRSYRVGGMRGRRGGMGEERAGDRGSLVLVAWVSVRVLGKNIKG